MKSAQRKDVKSLKKMASPQKKAAGKSCAQAKCPSQAESSGYCRLHYLSNWKRIKLNDQLKAEARLNHFVDKLAKKYPDSYIEKIKEGVESEERFFEITKELDIESKEAAKETDSEFLERFLRAVKPGS